MTSKEYGHVMLSKANQTSLETIGAVHKVIGAMVTGETAGNNDSFIRLYYTDLATVNLGSDTYSLTFVSIKAQLIVERKQRKKHVAALERGAKACNVFPAQVNLKVGCSPGQGLFYFSLIHSSVFS